MWEEAQYVAIKKRIVNNSKIDQKRKSLRIAQAKKLSHQQRNTLNDSLRTKAYSNTFK